MALTVRMTQRYVVLLDAVRMANESGITNPTAVDIRRCVGFETTSAGFSSTVSKVCADKLLSKEKINQTINYYAITKAGHAFLKEHEKLLEAIEDKCAVYESAFTMGSVGKNTPEEPTTEVENAAITGLAKLIDDNKNMRGLLARLKLEIENALAE